MIVRLSGRERKREREHGYLFKSEPKKGANLEGLGTELKLNFFSSTFIRWVEIHLVILLNWIFIRLRIHQILWIRIHVTEKNNVNFHNIFLSGRKMAA